MQRRHFQHLILSIALLIANNTAGAQISSVFRHITVADGLAGNNVYSIAQDDKGFIWIGTDQGLQRYDGYNFVNYRCVLGDTTTIGAQQVTQVWIDQDQQVWTNETAETLALLDPRTGRCRRPLQLNDPLIYKGDSSHLLDSRISHDNLGRFWLSSPGRLAKYDPGSKRFLPCREMIPMPLKDLVNWVYVDQATHRVWMQTDGGMLLFDSAKRTYYDRRHNPDHIDLLSENTPAILSVYENWDIWGLCLDGTLYYYDARGMLKKKYQPEEVFPDWPKTHVIDYTHRGSLLANSRWSVLIAQKPSSSLVWHVPGYDRFFSTVTDWKAISGLQFVSSINCLFKDKQGRIWVGTDRGINIFRPYLTPFVEWNFLSQKENAHRQLEAVNDIVLPNGETWMTTWGHGVAVLDDSSHLKKLYTYNAHNPGGFGEKGNEAMSIIHCADGKIWVGGYRGLLSIFDTAKRRFTNYYPPILNNKTIVRFAADQQDNIWLFTWGGGLRKWDFQKKAFENCPAIDQFLQKDSSIQDLAIDKKNNLWVAVGNSGLVKIDPLTGHCTDNYRHHPGDSHSLSGNYVSSIIIINDSLLGIALYHAGLNVFNIRTGKVEKIFTMEQGLKSNRVEALYYERPSWLWAMTYNGVCRINLHDDHVTNYGEDDGIPVTEFDVSRRFFRLKNGTVIAPHEGGLILFTPGNISDKPPPDNVMITGFSIFQKPLPIDSILSRTDTIDLSYKQNFFTIQYASFDFTRSRQINYWYQLVGVDKHWVYAGPQNTAHYTNIPGGSYTFRVKAENTDGVPTLAVTSLIVIIDPPFWKQTWFYALLLLAALLAGYSLYRYRINQILGVQAMRNKISRDLHDDLGATLSSISVLSEVAKSTTRHGAPEEADRLLTKINVYSTEMVDKMRDIVWAINPSNDTMENIIQRLRNYAAECCAPREIQPQFEGEDCFRKMMVPMYVRKNIYLICKEAIHNAARHSGCRTISIRIAHRHPQLTMEIRDDGHGFDTTATFSGDGLINMGARAREIGAILQVRSSPAGTTLLLQLIVPRFRE